MAVVTGASSGIGAATARLLAERGHDVGITYCGDADGAMRTAGEVEARGGRAPVAQLDLAAPGSIDPALKHLIEELGGIDALVSNAGANRRREAIAETADGWRAALDVNLVGPSLCARVAAEWMRSAGRGGRIVNVTSVLAFAPLESAVAYGAAKAGLELATKVMALEWAADGIAVNAVAPGHAATPMNFAPDALGGDTIERPVIPLARAADPEEIAAAIAFLASDDSSYATGSSLLADGGLLLASGPSALQRATDPQPAREARG